MKRVVPIFAMLSLYASGAWAQQSGQITTLQAAASLSNAQASQHQHVSFEGTVIYYDGGVWVQDGDAAIYAWAPGLYKLVPGDRVRVSGVMHESFKPFVENAEITKLGHGALPKPLHPTFDQMIRAETDCRLITVRAVIQSADLAPSTLGPVSTTQMSILVEGGHHAEVAVHSTDPSRLKDLLDAEVEITGAQSGTFDNKMQQTGILIHVQSWEQVKILKRAEADPWSIPITPMDRILTGYHVHDQSDRQRVHGTITYYQPGVALVLEDGTRSIWIATDSRNPLHLGRVADAIGFPDVTNGFLTLTHGEVHETATQAPVTPSLFTWLDLARGGNDSHGRVFDLVSVEGRVVAEVRQATQDEYVLDSDGHLLSAIIHHRASSSTAPLEPMREIPVGTRIRVTGICMLTDANPFNGEIPFDVLLRSFDDITVVAQPSLLSVRNLIIVIGLLLALVIAVGTASWARERKSSRRIGTLAYVEQRRARILEAINHSKPLAEILERVTELVSVRLNGAPCWCQVADGPTLGNRPVKLPSSSLRTVELPIASRTGSTLGSVFAAFDARTKGDLEETTALAMAAELATLAIETSHLYTDLVHRSEFDLLTDVENRFVMEKKLAAMIQAARQSAGVFGLIYIDLNHFKRVNDVHGHLVGDLYLQDVAQRMKRQLRPGDTLARLGGDEFAVLVPVVHSRDEVEEIAARLEFCFHEPFVSDKCVIHGSASVGLALYPEDAETVETLLGAADAQMYAAKYTRVGQSREAEALDEDDLVKRDCS
jgi:diguanylate cyclase (GGDEF)-like protein